MILKGVADAFDISREDPKLIERYDTTPFLNPKNWDDPVSGKPKNKLQAVHHPREEPGKLLAPGPPAGGGGMRIHYGEHRFRLGLPRGYQQRGRGSGEEVRDRSVRFMPSPRSSRTAKARGLGEKILLVCCGENGTHAPAE